MIAGAGLAAAATVYSTKHKGFARTAFTMILVAGGGSIFGPDYQHLLQQTIWTDASPAASGALAGATWLGLFEGARAVVGRIDFMKLLPWKDVEKTESDDAG